MGDTVLAASDCLPLTCSRSGTCCHGKAIWLNPWELARLAAGRGISARDFRDRFTTDGGLRLRVDGPAGWRGLPQCSQYAADSGCTVHAHRPLACRLYPLGRRRQRENSQYFHEGSDFPCDDGCPEVRALPALTVATYLSGQQVADGEAAQDAYLEVMQDLAEGALVLLLDSGLAASGDRLTLPRWRTLGDLLPAQRAATLPTEWFDLLTVPPGLSADDAVEIFVRQHKDLLQTQAQTHFATSNNSTLLHEASCLMMALSLHLGRSLGIETPELAERWIQVARSHGAQG